MKPDVLSLLDIRKAIVRGEVLLTSASYMIDRNQWSGKPAGIFTAPPFQCHPSEI